MAVIGSIKYDLNCVKFIASGLFLRNWDILSVSQRCLFMCLAKRKCIRFGNKKESVRRHLLSAHIHDYVK